MSSQVRRIVVVGGGALAWIAAGGLRRALQHLDLEVTVLDVGPERDASVARWTLPSQRGVHAQLGIAEVDFVRATGATFKLATEFVGWQGEGTRFLHAHGDIGSPVDGSPFYKYLLARETGQRLRPEAFSIAAAAVRLGRFARPMGADSDLTASFTYGYHVDENAYTAYLRAHAQKLGVRRVANTLGEVLFSEDARIAALRLANGESLTADYFIDCSGRESQLFGRMDNRPRIDWSSWLPCDRMLSVLTAPAADMPPATRIVAGEAGWTFHAPLAESSLAGSVYASRFMSDPDALDALRSAAGALRGEPVLTHISAGRRACFWRRNCVALGRAAVDFEPLAGAELHFAQLGLALFMELFPLDARSEVESAEYDRLMAEHAESLRDFTIAHYRLSRRPGPFWDAVRASPPPAPLANKLDLYCATGRIDLRDQETFEEVDWAWLLLGSGTIPDALEWQLHERFRQLPAAEVASLAQHIESLAGTMPPHADVLRWLRSPATP